MPARLIRDGLMESEAVLSLPVEARWLFVTILLSADDYGMFEAQPFKLARRAELDRKKVDGWIRKLADADLVRLYEVEKRPLGFIPKFGQRLRISRPKFPLPPEHLFSDLPESFNKISNITPQNDSDLRTNVRDPRSYDGELRTNVRQSRPEVEAEAEAEAEEKTKSTAGDRQQTDRPPLALVGGPPAAAAPCPYDRIVDAFHEAFPVSPRVKHMTEGRRTHMAARWREDRKRQRIEWWQRLFGWIQQSDFLMGRVAPQLGRPPFVLTIDFVIRSEETIVKIMEGHYHREQQA